LSLRRIFYLLNLIVLLSFQNAVWGINAADSTQSDFVFVAVTPSQTEATSNGHSVMPLIQHLILAPTPLLFDTPLKQKLRELIPNLQTNNGTIQTIFR
jgi:hypothetical protein